MGIAEVTAEETSTKNSATEESEVPVEETVELKPAKEKKKNRKSVAVTKEEIAEVTAEERATENSATEESEVPVEETVELKPAKEKKKKRKSVAVTKEEIAEVTAEETTDDSAPCESVPSEEPSSETGTKEKRRRKSAL